jgi:transposase
MPTSNYKTTVFEGQAFYVGLDVHKKSWNVTIRTLGIEVAHFSQPPDADQLVRYLNNRYPGGKFFSAYEPGFCGTTIHWELCKAGIVNIIINPADLPQTDKHKKNKTDVHDSRTIGRYLEAGVLRGIYIMAADQQQRRSLFRLRSAKVKEVTRCNNRLRSFLCFSGIQLPEHLKDKGYLSGRILNFLRTVSTVTEAGKDCLDQFIYDLEYQRHQLLVITKKLRQSIMSFHKDDYSSVITAPGIGPITAMALLTETGDLRRFNDPDQYVSYLGLMPAERSSGDSLYSVKLQPRCNKHLRPLLIEAAWIAISKCPVLLSYYKKHAGKNNKNAIIKVASKLALIAKALAINKTTYQPKWKEAKDSF